MGQVLEFTGRFHPLLVHLPIGFLLIAVVFIWLKEGSRVVKISIALGALAAVVSVITGLLLADSEGYGEEVSNHKWSGIVLGIVSVGMWLAPERSWKPGSIVMGMLVLLTGHLGGTLTHGPLITKPEAESLDVTKIDFRTAAFYDDAVKEVLEARCYSCHGETKQKGRLRLDDAESIIKGGKNGKVIVPGNPEESELVKRIELPMDNEDHMPPKERKQLTGEEKKLISLWVASGADFDKKIAESLNESQIRELSVKENAIELPDADVPVPDNVLISKLVERNIAITPVSKESNFLQVNFISVPDAAATLIDDLRPIAKNVVWLKLNDTNIGDFEIGDFVNLTELNLAGTRITDRMIDEIVKCRQLVRLNLSNTKVKDITKLKDLQSLKYLNIYNTSIADVSLPNVKIEKGNYNVPTLQSDTTEVKTN